MKNLCVIVLHPESDGGSIYWHETLAEARKCIDSFEPVEQMVSYIFTKEEIDKAIARTVPSEPKASECSTNPIV